MSPTLTLQRTIAGARTSWSVIEPEAKLAWRGRLPGASTYDRAAHALRGLQASGAAAVDLLSLAMPVSWMVNTKATSRAMQRWLAPPLVAVWAELLDLLSFELSPEGWLEMRAQARERCVGLVTVLADGNDGATLAAVSKVLALLRPQLVPLMDDAALWFALDLVPEPDTAERPSAPPGAFLPMLDWFAHHVLDREDALVALASRHELAVLDAAQTLDRILWVESWGHRQMPK